jgi:phenylalanyl-tRNA synthetase beta chain
MKFVSRRKFNLILLFLKCSRDDVAEKFGKTIESVPAVHLSNPKTIEFQVLFQQKF